MPISVYRCQLCGLAQDRLHRVGQRPTATVCTQCGGEAVYDLARTCRPARIPSRWGDSASYYDRGLGMDIQNSSHRERVMQERGLVCEGDLGSGVAEQMMHREYTEHRDHERLMGRVQDIAREQHVPMGEALGLAVSESVTLDTLE